MWWNGENPQNSPQKQHSAHILGFFVCAIFLNEINALKNRCTFSEDFCQIVLAVFVAYRYKITQAMTPIEMEIRK